MSFRSECSLAFSESDAEQLQQLGRLLRQWHARRFVGQAHECIRLADDAANAVSGDLKRRLDLRRLLQQALHAWRWRRLAICRCPEWGLVERCK
eukprot:4564930-Prymnesium_polylepis.2